MSRGNAPRSNVTLDPNQYGAPTVHSQEGETSQAPRVTQGIVDAASELERRFAIFKRAQLDVHNGVDEVNQAVAEVAEQLSQTTLGASLPARSPKKEPSTTGQPQRNQRNRKVGQPTSTTSTTGTSTATTSTATTSTATTSTTPRQAIRGSEPPTTSASNYSFQPAYPATTVDLGQYRSSPSSAKKSVYVVYIGQGGSHGVYKDYQTAMTVARQDDKNRLIKKFPDAKLAKKCYDDCVRWGVLDLLAEPWAANELFIVVKGANPGVYSGRGRLLKVGLRWRGGYVVRVLGTEPEAKLFYETYVAGGETEPLASFVPDGF
ncbi:hypothetical protein VNI00_019084 [Paramarasmius palmivorus]|uniref:Uncharacterized protein n=1 Tax=Paramarasmius palmivorus TaxID=297713 RepID=A0AAW0ARA6_9AGAR